MSDSETGDCHDVEISGLLGDGALPLLAKIQLLSMRNPGLGWVEEISDLKNDA